MKSTPLLMKGPLVRRSLDGRKTMTRRLVTSLAGIGKVIDLEKDHESDGWNFGDSYKRAKFLRHRQFFNHCPYGTAGDELWGRETFAEKPPVKFYAYKADGVCGYPRWNHGEPYFAHHGYLLGYPEHREKMSRFYSLDSFGGKWRPAIFMPREACRLVMPITEVRIEQLQDITGADIIAEGVADLTLDELLEMGATRSAILKTAQSVLPRTGGYYWLLMNVMWPQSFTLRERFQIVWDLIYGADPATCWAANPWVWPISYKRKVTT